MYKWIKNTASEFEGKASKTTILGIKVSTFAFLLAVLSFIEVIFINTGLGRTGVIGGVLAGIFGIFLALIGKIEKPPKSISEESSKETNFNKKPWH